MRDFPTNARVHLVGHSLGGVVARYFAQEIGDARVAQTISLASPFAGVPGTRWLGLPLAKDLRPQSGLLRRLNLGSHHETAVPHLSLVAEADVVLPAPMSHVLPGGDVTLRGWLIPGGTERVVVQSHFGVQCSRAGYTPKGKGLIKMWKEDISFLRQARHLHERGYTVLMYDMRNHGESDPGTCPWVSWGPEEARDVIAAVDFHALAVTSELPGRPEELLDLGDDDDDEDGDDEDDD